jgi:murein DD-endopeptidase MepM/ murein hydrolase activator NlpD
MRHRLARLTLSCVLLASLLPDTPVRAEEQDDPQTQEMPVIVQSAEDLPTLRKMEQKTEIPWYYLAAINQYEAGIHWQEHRNNPNPPKIQIKIPGERWAGPFNPQPEDSNPATIGLFGGLGLDGNGDGKADPHNPDDQLYTFASMVAKRGHDDVSIRQALWDYYQNGIVVDRISGFARIFKEMGTVNVTGNAFPIPLNYNYSYRSTWGDARGWGGRRSHEGCDIFASTGTPVLATAHGVVEVAGWNKYGGWRIGIRDLNNVYHYFAHLSAFEKNIKRGAIVKPGQVIGYVGSTGYGRPGTSGKFAPHLHYGMYRDTGTREWAFDPTPHLRKWEREARKARKK